MRRGLAGLTVIQELGEPLREWIDHCRRGIRIATGRRCRIAGVGARKRSRREKVPAGIVQMIQLWSETPAFVEGRYTDVLAVNSLATALAPYYTVGTNLVRATFLDPRVPEMYDDWE